MSVGRNVTLMLALALVSLVTCFGCQGEDAQGDSKSGSSGSSGVTIQVANGTFDGSAPQGETTGETTALTSGERFSEDNLRKVDKFVAQQMEQQNLPSVVVGVWASGEGEYLTAHGKANLETGEQRGLGQPYRIASITKTFTATAVLQLVDEGKLKTSDKLSEWYPDFPNAKKITVDDLLRMRSGIPDFTDEEFMKNWYAHPKADITAQNSIERSAKKVDQFKPPDQETSYANINYVLLQEIVRKVSGEPLGTRIAKGILEPLGMEDSFYATDDTLPGSLRGYSWNPTKKEFQDKSVLNPAVPGGAGAIVSTLADLRPYAKALCEGDLLSPETQQARKRSEVMEGDPDFVRYGQGLLMLGDFCGHNGTIFGFSSEMFYLPQKEAVVLVNVSRLDLDDQSKSTEIFLGVSKILFPEYVDW
jgi:D-alanyl-D-alanine carboxypeptidase